MTPAAPMRGNRRGFRRWIWIALASLSVLATLPNLWLASPSGRQWLATRIQRRTGLETRIAWASVTPWGGIRIRRIELLQPPALRASVRKPFARVESIHLEPFWRSLLRGELELESVTLDSPQVVIPVELIAELAKSAAATQPPANQPPPVASNSPAIPRDDGPPATPPAVIAPQAAPHSPPPAVIQKPTAWLRLKHASFSLTSATSGRDLLQFAGFDGAIPVSGGPAQSRLHLESIDAPGANLVRELDLTLAWRAPFLTCNPLETEISGLKSRFAARIALVRGLPLQIEIQAPAQKPRPLDLPGGIHAEAESFSAAARFGGILLAPATWQGDFVSQTMSPVMRVREHEARFDHGKAVVVLRGGVLSCADARLIGDDLSFLGNATLLADGRLAAALRMVAPADTATVLARNLFPTLESPPLTALSTPQRCAFDLEAFGNIGHAFLQLGKDGPVVELNR